MTWRNHYVEALYWYVKLPSYYITAVLRLANRVELL